MLRFITSASLVALLTGCSVWGGNTFQCPATNVDGATCMSARQVYEATHTTDRVAPNFKDGKPIEPADRQAAASTTMVAAASPGTQNVLNTYLPPLPDADAPLPVRTPAKVMRIRIFPWEDSQRDLNTGGFVFTEVEGRQWTLGDDQVSRVQANVITPLAMPKGARPPSSTSPLAMPAPGGRPAVPPSQSGDMPPPMQLPGIARPQGSQQPSGPSTLRTP